MLSLMDRSFQASKTWYKLKNIAWEVYIDELNELHISSGHIDKDNLKRASSEQNCNVTQVIIIILFQELWILYYQGRKNKEGKSCKTYHPVLILQKMRLSNLFCIDRLNLVFSELYLINQLKLPLVSWRKYLILLVLLHSFILLSVVLFFSPSEN